MLHNQSRDPAHLMCAKATIGHKRYRLQPEFGHRPLPLHMDVRRSPRSELKKMKLYGPSRSTVGIEPHCLHTCFYTQRKDFTQNRKKWLLKKPNALHHLPAEAGEARCSRSGACR